MQLCNCSISGRLIFRPLEALRSRQIVMAELALNWPRVCTPFDASVRAGTGREAFTPEVDTLTAEKWDQLAGGFDDWNLFQTARLRTHCVAPGG